MVLASLSTVERAAADAVVSRRPGWSKGLTALTDPRVARMARARTGQGSWSKGLTAASDVRIARNAANRRGRRRGPLQESAGREPDRALPGRSGAERTRGRLRICA